jgi:hypothetical protein
VSAILYFATESLIYAKPKLNKRINCKPKYARQIGTRVELEERRMTQERPKNNALAKPGINTHSLKTFATGPACVCTGHRAHRLAINQRCRQQLSGPLRGRPRPRTMKSWRLKLLSTIANPHNNLVDVHRVPNVQVRGRSATTISTRI